MPCDTYSLFPPTALCAAGLGLPDPVRIVSRIHEAQRSCRTFSLLVSYVSFEDLGKNAATSLSRDLSVDVKWGDPRS